MMQRGVLPDLLNHFQDEDVTFSPWEGAMTTGDLVWHILSTSFTFANAAATGVFERVSEKPQLSTIADLKTAVDTWTAKTVDVIQSMSDEQFEQLIDMTKLFGRAVPAGSLLHSMRDHEIHHKGQLYVYARLCGRDQLPFFIKLS